MKMLYGFCTVAIIALLTFVGVQFFKNQQTISDDLPTEFSHYTSIDSSSVIKAGKVSMTLLLESTEDIKTFLTPNNEVIVYTVPEKKTNSFYKISRDGVLIDSLTLKCRQTDIAFVKGYVIDRKYHQYYKWGFDGNKEAVNIPLQNERLDWDLKKQQEQLKVVKEKSTAVYVDYETKTPEPIKPAADGEIQAVPTMETYTVLTYFVNDDCFRFFTTLDTDKDFPYSYTEKLLLNDLFKRINTKVSGNKEIIKAPEIKYRYFQKLKLEKVRFSGGGGNAAPFDVMLFHGNLFTDVIYKTDTLKLKEFMYLDQKWHQSSIEIDGKNIGTLMKNKKQPPHDIDAYMYYTNPQIDYALFTNNDKKLYLIK
ncbi:hypothetical protein [Mucilaginibacter auburnensis]|uniref:Uncharacterized protein n=1 Tax=Mucilaginibacter auburnensis TaxID=1457233 RepID=A0A2H9VUF8_9SPHI|nr:hypothetical protein [Mucilaginibacter auburnensis]PJJ84431.1 hypothetical protein CLV57_1443 [Mucilaginibacter auburnensis]